MDETNFGILTIRRENLGAIRAEIRVLGPKWGVSGQDEEAALEIG